MPPAAHAHPRRRRAAALALVFVAPALLPPATGGRTAEPPATARRLAEAGWRPADVRPILRDLERRTERFLAQPPGPAAREAGGSLLAELQSLSDGLSTHLEETRRAVLERDEDPQTLLQNPGFRERQALALTALYYLSWVRYRQATLAPAGAADRRRLLEQAVHGFTEFVYVNEIPDLYGDCLYGRALAFHALGRRRDAVADLEAVLELGARHPAHARARAALAAVRAGKPVDLAPVVDPAAGELARLRELLRAHALPPPAAPGGEALRRREEGQRQALALARTLAARDAATRARVDDIVDDAALERGGAFVEVLRGDLARDRGDESGARAHYQGALAANDPDAAGYRDRALFGAAGAAYREGDYAGAVTGFERLLAEAPGSEHAEAALYFRFKAIEAADAGAYDASLGAYLERFPSGRYAPELRYRRAERYWRDGDCGAALETLGTPTDGDTWSLAARYIVVDCEAQVTRAAWRGEGAEAEAHYARALGNARALAGAVTNGDDARARDLAARASVVAALLAATAAPPRSEDVLGLLDGFETRFPAAGPLAADAVALRAVARARLGNAAGAGSDIATLAAAPDGVPEDRLRQVGRELLREAEGRDEAGRRALFELARAAYTPLVPPPPPSGDLANGASAGGAGVLPTDVAALAEIALALGDPAEAAAAYARLRTLDPGSMEGLRGGARALAAAGREEEALALWIDLAGRSEPGATLWYEGMIEAARTEESLGRRRDACTRLAAAAAASPRAAAGALAETAATLRRQLCP
jgi:tetratricopeptide (TPR) repeat protein